MRTSKYLILLLLIVLFASQQMASAQTVEYVCGPAALDNFAPNIYRGSYADNPYAWASEQGCERMLFDEKGYWTPTALHFAVYRGSTVGFWFGSDDASSAAFAQTAEEKLHALLERIKSQASPEQWQYVNDLRVFRVYAAPGQRLRAGISQDGHLINELKKEERRYTQLLDQFDAIDKRFSYKIDQTLINKLEAAGTYPKALIDAAKKIAGQTFDSSKALEEKLRKSLNNPQAQEAVDHFITELQTKYKSKSKSDEGFSQEVNALQNELNELHEALISNMASNPNVANALTDLRNRYLAGQFSRGNQPGKSGNNGLIAGNQPGRNSRSGNENAGNNRTNGRQNRGNNQNGNNQNIGNPNHGINQNGTSQNGSNANGSNQNGSSQEGGGQNADGQEGEESGNSNGGDGGSGGSGGGSGAKGPFSIDSPFSEWFAVMAKFIARYLGIEEIANQVLMVAYMVAPELFNEIASFLGHLQQAITPDALDKGLNHLAYVINHAARFIELLQQAHALLTDEAFVELLKELDLKKGLRYLEKYANVDMPGWLDHLPLDGISFNNLLKLNSADLAKKLQKEITKRAYPALTKALEKSGIPVLKDLDLAKLHKAIKSGKYESFIKHQMKEAIDEYVPAEYRQALKEVIDGNYKKAITHQSASEMSKRLGLNVSPADLDSLYTQMMRGETDKALQNFVPIVSSRLGEYSELVNLAAKGDMEGVAKSGIKLAVRKAGHPEYEVCLFEGGPAACLSQLANQYDIPLSTTDIKNILSGKTPRDLSNKVKQLYRKIQNAEPGEITWPQAKDFLINTLDGYAKILDGAPSGIKRHVDDYFSSTTARSLSKTVKDVDGLLQDIDRELPKWTDGSRWRALFTNFESYAESVLNAMGAMNTASIEQLAQQLEISFQDAAAISRWIQDKKYNLAWKEWARIKLPKLNNATLRQQARALLNGTWDGGETALLNTVERLAAALPELGSGKVWWSLPRSPDQAIEVLQKLLKEIPGVPPEAKAHLAFSQQVLEAISKGDIDRAFATLLEQAAPILNIYSKRALELLKEGKIDDALIEQAKTTLPNFDQTWSTEANLQLIRNRIHMLKLFLKEQKRLKQPKESILDQYGFYSTIR